MSAVPGPGDSADVGASPTRFNYATKEHKGMGRHGVRRASRGRGRREAGGEGEGEGEGKARQGKARQGKAYGIFEAVLVKINFLPTEKDTKSLPTSPPSPPPPPPPPPPFM